MASKDEETGHAPDSKSRILFGSCNSQEYPQPLWSVMASRNATAFVWAGDAIYAGKVLPFFVKFNLINVLTLFSS
jgi:alkaline phosphatase D